MVEVAHRAGGEYQGDVHDDERNEEEHHGQVHCAGDGQRIDARDSSTRPWPQVRHAQPGDDCQRCRDEHDGEIGELLQRVVVRPAAFNRPLQRRVLNRCRHRVGQHVPCGRNQAHPLAGDKEQHHEHDAVDDPQRVEREVQPQVERDFLWRALGANEPGVVADPVRGGALSGAHEPTRASNEDDEESVQEVLKVEPPRKANRSVLRQLGFAGIGGQEVCTGARLAPPTCEQDDGHQHHESDGNPQRELLGATHRRASSSAINAGTTVNTSPTTPKSATSKIGASASLLMATIVPAVCMPARC